MDVFVRYNDEPDPKSGFFNDINMEEDMDRIMIAATHSGAGKTTITSGLIRAIKNRGLKVQPYKVGPDYIDTSYHKLASGLDSHNLDEFILGKDEIRRIFTDYALTSDISVTEGVMGLFDGYQSDSDYCSSASMAKILDCPVILIIDAKAMAGSAAALVKGFVEFDKELDIKGVILNNVSSENHFNILKIAIENHVQVKVLGRLPKQKDISLPSRHLGLVMQDEIQDSESKMQVMANLVEEYVDIDEILKISKVKALTGSSKKINKNYSGVRLAVAYDKAFNFYYPDSLNLIKKAGITIKYFSPLADKRIPDCDGIYLGGGYPEVFADELSQNTYMLDSIKTAADNGMPIYAECGGLMYLGEYLLDDDNNKFEMSKIFAGYSKMSKGLKRFGYCEGKLTKATVIGDMGQIVRGHEFHHSEFFTDMPTVYKMEKELSDGSVSRWESGYIYKNTFGTYLHTHFGSNYEMIYKFCEAMEVYSEPHI